MPIYEYKCPSCGTKFEEIKIGAVPVSATCPNPKCTHYLPLEPLMSAPAIAKLKEGGTR